MSDDLVKRLRDLGYDGVISEAADRIEADAKRIAEVEGAGQKLLANWQNAEARAEAAEARVKVLEDALRNLDKAASGVARYGAQTGPQWSKLTIAILKVRAALEGEK